MTETSAPAPAPLGRWWPDITPGTSRTEGERLISLACAVRLTGVAAADQGWSTRANRAETAAEHFADWLADCGEPEARTRRYVLLLACELAVPGDTGWRDVIETAKWMLAFARST